MADMVALHVGCDSTLLSTRTDILRQAGFSIVPVSTAAEATKIFIEGDFDAVILCHSVPTEERRILADFVHRTSSSTPVILIAVTYESDPAADAVIENIPTELVMQLPGIVRKGLRRQNTRPPPVHMHDEWKRS